MDSCHRDKNWVVNTLLFEERREEFQLIYEDLYNCIQMPCFSQSEPISKWIIREAYEQCMRKRHTIDDLERAAALDRADLLNNIDQQVAKSGGDKESHLLRQLKDKLEVQKRVYINHEDLKFKRHIGHGASGSVYEAVWLEKPFAVKVFQKGDRTFPREFEALSVVKHPNILHIAGYSDDSDQHMLVMEKMDMDLTAFLRNMKAPLKYLTLVSIALQIASGMDCLHSRQIIHRDLKPQNVLIGCTGDDILVVRVADFGLARTGFITSLISGATSKRGTKNYMAPEVWTSENYSKKADVYSFGMLCYQLLTMKVPFEDTENFMDLVVTKGLRPPLPADNNLTQIIAQCWRQDPNERPEFSDVCHKLKMVKGAYLAGTEHNVEAFLPPEFNLAADNLMTTTLDHHATSNATHERITNRMITNRMILLLLLSSLLLLLDPRRKFYGSYSITAGHCVCLNLQQ